MRRGRADSRQEETPSFFPLALSPLLSVRRSRGRRVFIHLIFTVPDEGACLSKKSPLKINEAV